MTDSPTHPDSPTHLDPHATSLERMLALCTTHPFVQICPSVFDQCVRLRLSCADRAATRYCTWRPAGSHFVTLIQHEGITLLYCHANDTVYYTQPCVRLQGTCPDGTAILGQWCEDSLDGQAHPRLLMFDVACKGSQCYKSRGAVLRDMAVHLPQPLCTLQWSGECSALRGFLGTLPHQVECLLELGSDSFAIECHQLKETGARSAMEGIIADIMFTL